MQRREVSSREVDRDAVRAASDVLRQGGIVALPTETVYGMCVDASNAEAVARLYAAKGRQAQRACAYLLPDRDAAPELPLFAARLADAFWPGPVTLVVPEGSTWIGLRLPDHPLARAIAAEAGRPLLQTSANRSGQPAALNAAGVAEVLGEHVTLLLDGGRAPGGRSSTVVRCSGREFRVLRTGLVTETDVVRAATELTLVACTGNLCRSPLAEALFRHVFAQRLGCAEKDLVWRGHRFGSFGVMAGAGRPATDHAIQVAEEHGLDLRAHRSRPFTLRLVQQARRVYGLSRTHLDFLHAYFEARPDDLALLDPKGREIHDPYGHTLRTYRKVGGQIARAIERRADELLGDKDATLES